MNHRRNTPAAQRYAERRRQEDEAPRLSSEVPDLVGLRLEIEEHAGVGGTRHTRRVLVDHAPARFFVPCGDPRCLDGGHDLTAVVMRALRTHQTRFSGDDACQGSVGPSDCSRTLHFDAFAEYRS